MKTTLVVLLLAGGGEATEPRGPAIATAVVAAQKELGTARRTLARAMENTRGRNPTAAELAAATAALDALKSALQSGAELETSSAEYAKSAAAARNDLAARRVDFAIANLNANAQHPQGRVFSAEDLRAAEVALAALKTELDAVRPKGKRDPSYAMYLSAIDMAVARHEEAFDENWTRLVKERRQALATAMAALPAEAGLAQRQTADDAATRLGALLEETARAEARNAPVRADAGRARTELAQAMTVLRPDGGQRGDAGL